MNLINIDLHAWFKDKRSPTQDDELQLIRAIIVTVRDLDMECEMGSLIAPEPEVYNSDIQLRQIAARELDE